MTSKDDKPSIGDDAIGKEPGWASGLRQLYDSVVEEDIPDNFRDLLSKLDSPKDS